MPKLIDETDLETMKQEVIDGLPRIDDLEREDIVEGAIVRLTCAFQCSLRRTLELTRLIAQEYDKPISRYFIQQYYSNNFREIHTFLNKEGILDESLADLESQKIDVHTDACSSNHAFPMFLVSTLAVLGSSTKVNSSALDIDTQEDYPSHRNDMVSTTSESHKNLSIDDQGSTSVPIVQFSEADTNSLVDDSRSKEASGLALEDNLELQHSSSFPFLLPDRLSRSALGSTYNGEPTAEWDSIFSFLHRIPPASDGGGVATSSSHRLGVIEQHLATEFRSEPIVPMVSGNPAIEVLDQVEIDALHTPDTSASIDLVNQSLFSAYAVDSNQHIDLEGNHLPESDDTVSSSEQQQIPVLPLSAIAAQRESLQPTLKSEAILNVEARLQNAFAILSTKTGLHSTHKAAAQSVLNIIKNRLNGTLPNADRLRKIVQTVLDADSITDNFSVSNLYELMVEILQLTESELADEQRVSAFPVSVEKAVQPVSGSHSVALPERPKLSASTRRPKPSSKVALPSWDIDLTSNDDWYLKEMFSGQLENPLRFEFIPGLAIGYETHRTEDEDALLSEKFNTDEWYLLKEDLSDINPLGPSSGMPGSEDKIKMLTARYGCGQPLWNEKDTQDQIPTPDDDEPDFFIDEEEPFLPQFTAKQRSNLTGRKPKISVSHRKKYGRTERKKKLKE